MFSESVFAGIVASLRKLFPNRTKVFYRQQILADRSIVFKRTNKNHSLDVILSEKLRSKYFFCFLLQKYHHMKSNEDKMLKISFLP